LGKDWQPSAKKQTIESKPTPATEEEAFWGKIHAIQECFHGGLEKCAPREATNALLELDRAIWQAKQDLENEEFISQAREILRDLIVVFGMKLESSPKDRDENLAALVEDLVKLRERFRRNKQWHEADEVRGSLQRAGVIVKDTAEGPRWRLKS
jgi:cysteinyl-tRNA synthetase